MDKSDKGRETHSYRDKDRHTGRQRDSVGGEKGTNTDRERDRATEKQKYNVKRANDMLMIHLLKSYLVSFLSPASLTFLFSGKLFQRTWFWKPPCKEKPTKSHELLWNMCGNQWPMERKRKYEPDRPPMPGSALACKGSGSEENPKYQNVKWLRDHRHPQGYG